MTHAEISDLDKQAREVSDRVISVFIERAVPAVRSAQVFQSWALNEAAATDAQALLDGRTGKAGLCWDEAVVIYQADGEPVCEVRADPVAPDRVVAQLDKWIYTTWPPFMKRSPEDETISREYIGPHPLGGFTNILVSFAPDPDDAEIYQAHLSVAWLKEQGA